MDFSQLIAERYSVRKFSSEPVSEKDVQAILEAARLAPTACNKQPCRVLLLEKPESIARLKHCTTYTFDAPLVLAVCGVTDEAWVRPFDQANASIVDASILGTHIMLAVHDLGLGSTWVGHFDPAVFRVLFNLPANVVPVALFPIGHPASDARPSPMHAQRRELEELVVREKF